MTQLPGEYNNIKDRVDRGQQLLWSFEFQEDLDVTQPPEEQEFEDEEPIQILLSGIVSESVAWPGGLVYDFLSDHPDLESFNIAISAPGEELSSDPLEAWALMAAVFDPVSQMWEVAIRYSDGSVSHYQERWPNSLEQQVLEFVRASIVGERLSDDELRQWQEQHPKISFV